MKYLIISISIICTTQNGLGQTYIGPLLGYDFARIQSNSKEINSTSFQTTKTGYVNKSPVLGIKLEQYLFPYLYLSFQTSYTHKYVPATGYGIVPVFGIKFDYFQQYLSFRYLIANTIYVGGGINYNFINRIDWDNGIELPYQNIKDNDSGLHISTGIKLNNFDLELYFYKSNSHFTEEIFGIIKLDPITSFGLNLSYEIKVFDKIKLFNKKGQSCPAF